MSTTTNDIGNSGEDFAAQYLIDNGYKILERNYRLGRCEADIIVEKDDFLILIEVKTRKFNSPQSITQAISQQQQSRLIMLANRYVRAKKIDHEVRFDLILLHYRGNSFDLKHEIEAFKPKW